MNEIVWSPIWRVSKTLNLQALRKFCFKSQRLLKRGRFECSNCQNATCSCHGWSEAGKQAAAAAAGGPLADGESRAAVTQLKQRDRRKRRERERDGEIGERAWEGCGSLLKGAEIWRGKQRCCCETPQRGSRPDGRTPRTPSASPHKDFAC